MELIVGLILYVIIMLLTFDYYKKNAKYMVCHFYKLFEQNASKSSHYCIFLVTGSKEKKSQWCVRNL